MIRPLLASLWLEKNNSFPPIEVNELINGIDLYQPINKEIEQLIKRKKGDESEGSIHFDIVNLYIESELERLSNQAFPNDQGLNQSTFQLDEIFRLALIRSWDIKI